MVLSAICTFFIAFAWARFRITIWRIVMVILYLVPLVLLLWGASYSGRQIYPDYILRAQAHAINGFFICCVFEARKDWGTCFS